MEASKQKSPPEVVSSGMFSAARELYISSTLLRLRIMQLNPVLKKFSEWDRHTEAMRKMEKELREAENHPLLHGGPAK